MKLVTAIIRPERLDIVREALIHNDIFRVTVSRCAGRGQGEAHDIYRGVEVAPDLIPKIRLEIACNDGFVEPCIQAIILAAGDEEGTIGDGKIFVTALEDCIRIRTGERGGAAI